jgi:hypothetical protein
MLEGRKHTRTPKRFLVQISAVHDPRLTGIASVENVSERGTRLTTWRSWELGSHLELKSPSTRDTWARARVVYCMALDTKAFAVGLDFLTQTSDWNNRSDLAAIKQRT